MTTRAQATGIPVQVTLGGQPYRASVWTQREFAEWEEWVRATYRKRAMEGIEDMPESLRSGFTLSVHDRASRITFVSDESTSLLSSPAGFIKAWWLSLRDNHPGITEDQVGELLLHPDTSYDELQELAIIGPAMERVKKKGTRAPKRKKKRRK